LCLLTSDECIWIIESLLAPIRLFVRTLDYQSFSILCHYGQLLIQRIAVVVTTHFMIGVRYVLELDASFLMISDHNRSISAICHVHIFVQRKEWIVVMILITDYIMCTTVKYSQNSTHIRRTEEILVLVFIIHRIVSICIVMTMKWIQSSHPRPFISRPPLPFSLPRRKYPSLLVHFCAVSLDYVSRVISVCIWIRSHFLFSSTSSIGGSSSPLASLETVFSKEQHQSDCHGSASENANNVCPTYEIFDFMHNVFCSARDFECYFFFAMGSLPAFRTFATNLTMNVWNDPSERMGN